MVPARLLKQMVLGLVASRVRDVPKTPDEDARGNTGDEQWLANGSLD